MIRYFITLIITLFVVNLYSQNTKQYKTKSTETFFINYDKYGKDYYDTSSIGTYSYGAYKFSMNYDLALGDTNYYYCIVAFDSLINTETGYVYEKDTVNSLRIDSIYAVMGHENNSGQNDTIRFKIVTLNSAGYPEESNVLWSEILVGQNFGADTNQWDYSGVESRKVDYVMPGGASNFAVIMEYSGDRSDTAMFRAGFGDRGAYMQLNKRAIKSQFYPNSYAAWMRYYNTVGILPTIGGMALYYDANGNNIYDDGIDSEDYIQNISIYAKVTIEYVVSIDEFSPNIAILKQNYPNPFNGTTVIDYELKENANVDLKIFDIAGREVQSITEGKKTIGKHSISINSNNMAKGIYYYSLFANDTRLTKKMIVL